MQEELEFKDLKIIEYEQDKNSNQKIQIDSIEDKIKFIIQMLQKLRGIHNHNNKNINGQ